MNLEYDCQINLMRQCCRDSNIESFSIWTRSLGRTSNYLTSFNPPFSASERSSLVSVISKGYFSSTPPSSVFTLFAQSCPLPPSPFSVDITAHLKRAQAPTPASHCTLPTVVLHNSVTTMIYVRLRVDTLIHHALLFLFPLLVQITNKGYDKVSCGRRRLTYVGVDSVNFFIFSDGFLTCAKRPSTFKK